MIFIVGDHGNPWGAVNLNAEPLSQNDGLNEYFIDKKIVTSGIPLMLVHPFNASGDLIISDVPVVLGDIPQTIASELKLPAEFPGVSIISLRESDERERRYFYYAWDGGWDREYLPQIEEYTINGHSWLLDSWKPAYQTYKPREGEPSLHR